MEVLAVTKQAEEEMVVEDHPGGLVAQLERAVAADLVDKVFLRLPLAVHQEVNNIKQTTPTTKS